MPLSGKMPQCSSFVFVALVVLRSASATGLPHPVGVYIPERRVVLPFVLFRFSYCFTEARTIPIPNAFLFQNFQNVKVSEFRHRATDPSVFDDDLNVGRRIWHARTA